MDRDETDARPKRRLAHEIGQDLDAISVDELGERVRLLEQEIERLKAESRRKLASREAAGAFFTS
ncbi:DUF1192 domain-containing protein [Enterovirga sp.]|jgi:uncharacterized small protein (DUF1192 family)|uniref:DUF1192 domain-containing protein n=1 Tax=Enterovirga sp. TaxID=2026350 RepID=UPI00261E4881|nr:DUF1192 domain-containing protein [Enterovirga sp.]MDB5589488.1 hypothetical protein [Enterovirga sp.]